MKIVIVVESIFGNTRDIAEAVGAGLRDGGHVVDVVDAGAAFADFDADAVVVGGPTHAFGMSRDSSRDDARRQAGAHGVTPVSTGDGMREWIQRIASGLRTRRAATFDTSVASHFPFGSAARRAARALRRQGFTLVDAPQQFRVGGVAGPLLDGEAARARRWGAALGALFDAQPGLGNSAPPA